MRLEVGKFYRINDYKLLCSSYNSLKNENYWVFSLESGKQIQIAADCHILLMLNEWEEPEQVEMTKAKSDQYDHIIRSSEPFKNLQQQLTNLKFDDISNKRTLYRVTDLEKDVNNLIAWVSNIESSLDRAVESLEKRNG